MCGIANNDESCGESASFCSAAWRAVSLDFLLLFFSLFRVQKFVQGLSILSRGTLEEKLCWTFQLYDINSDGHITKEEMNDIVTAIYNLMGHPVEEKIDEERIKAKVDRIFDVSVTRP
jgi:hypothetical protein